MLFGHMNIEFGFENANDVFGPERVQTVTCKGWTVGLRAEGGPRS